MRSAISEPHAQFRQADCCRCQLTAAAALPGRPEALPGRPEALPGRPELLPDRPELLPGRPELLPDPSLPDLPERLPGPLLPDRSLPPDQPQEPSPFCSCSTSRLRPPG
jgi:hypothetical protein